MPHGKRKKRPKTLFLFFFFPFFFFILFLSFIFRNLLNLLFFTHCCRSFRNQSLFSKAITLRAHPLLFLALSTALPHAQTQRSVREHLTTRAVTPKRRITPLTAHRPPSIALCLLKETGIRTSAGKSYNRYYRPPGSAPTI